MSKRKRINYSKENIEPIIKKSKSYRDVMVNLGLIDGANTNTLKKFIKLYNISTDHFYRGGYKMVNRNKNIEELLIKNGNISRGTLKRRLYKEGLKQPICELCGQDENWQGKKISLILDHINGINNDNRLENLQIVCPNCNASLNTFCRGNKLNKLKKEKLIKVNKKQLNLKNKINLIKLIINGFDLSKKGWSKLLGEKINCSSMYTSKLIKKYYPEIWVNSWKHG